MRVVRRHERGNGVGEQPKCLADLVEDVQLPEAFWPGAHHRRPGQEREDLASYFIDAQHSRSERVVDRLEVAQQGVDRRRPRSGRSADGVPNANDVGHRAAAENLLIRHDTSMPQHVRLPASKCRFAGGLLVLVR